MAISLALAKYFGLCNFFPRNKSPIRQGPSVPKTTAAWMSISNSPDLKSYKFVTQIDK